MNLFHRKKKDSLFLTCLLVGCLLVGCVSKPDRTAGPTEHPRAIPVYPVPIGPPETPGGQPQEMPATSESTQAVPGVPIEGPAEPQRIALVLGGAGVASFATVGLLKRFQEEGVAIDFIITTGWPTLFTLGYGFTKSVHDLEWFASRLKEKDFHSASIFRKGESSVEDRLGGIIGSTFRQASLDESKIPVVISATNTELGDSDVYERGDWKEPLLKTMSVPGIYRPLVSPGGNEWVQSLRGLDVEEASRRGARVIIAVDMYGDYLESFKGKKEGGVFRKIYSTELRKKIAKELKTATFSGKITLGKPPGDFAARRAAILAGYKEGTRLVKELHTLGHFN
jgi:predicted acylesterase/phospholipase RssA